MCQVWSEERCKCIPHIK
ncbi:hypothetical protein E5259_14995 [Blautia producta]|uniref:Uncharacterized protein n=1 Tax=Blautia producta TaxID=33035 RepID=A0A7G5N3I7_9FIRM|nr:hypothetical protein E5259_14995 [Blautia producta]